MYTRTSVPALADQANILPEVVVYMLGPVYDMCMFLWKESRLPMRVYLGRADLLQKFQTCEWRYFCSPIQVNWKVMEIFTHILKRVCKAMVSVLMFPYASPTRDLAFARFVDAVTLLPIVHTCSICWYPTLKKIISRTWEKTGIWWH